MCLWCPVWVCLIGMLPRCLAPENYCAIGRCCVLDASLVTLIACGIMTDRRTDRHRAVAYIAYSVVR